MNAAEQRLRALVHEGRLDLPLPAAGRTPERLRRLHDLAASEDLSVARLAEAHCDAAAILAEAGRCLLPHGALAGVWASKYGAAGATAVRQGHGWHVVGELGFCSGAGLLDVALVDARTGEDGEQLLLVPLRAGGVDIDTSTWQTDALRATATGRVRFDLDLDETAAVGGPGFYLTRRGFWHGAIGVAACWAGGAQAVLDATAARIKADNPHAAANVGRMAAACWAMDAALAAAGADIDDRPDEMGMTYALMVRHVIAAACRDVIDASVRATGPGPLAFDRDHSRRLADLRLYIEQHHHETDLETIGAETHRGA